MFLGSLLFDLSTSAANFASSFGWVTATTFAPLSAKSSHAKSISGPRAGFTSVLKSTPLFVSCCWICAITFARPGNVFDRASTCFHWAEPRSVLTAT